jgi:adenine-specific DNA-methyltransferase
MSKRRDPSPRLKTFARRMRREPTDAERKLWHLLRDRRLGGFKFRRQHPVGGYILDFFCMEKMLSVEADGGQHYDPQGLAYDQRRSSVLTEHGIRTLRLSDYDILTDPDAVARTIFFHLTEEPSPLPSPGVPGEGGRGTPDSGDSRI